MILCCTLSDLLMIVCCESFKISIYKIVVMWQNMYLNVKWISYNINHDRYYSKITMYSKY